MKYKVSVVVTAEEFMKLFPSINGNTRLEIKEFADGLDDGPALQSKGPPVRKRVSKINEALLDCLTFGQKNVSELKQALVDAGMSANSLSTGLSALQKTREVVAVGDGVYALAQQQAA